MTQLKKTLLVTGGAGFIGSHFVCAQLSQDPDLSIVNLDLLTYAANLENLEQLTPEQRARHHLIQGDINDPDCVEKIFADYDLEGVVHFAAESHVDNSIKGPRQFIETNISGTFTLLEAARKHWMEAPHRPKNPEGGAPRFHHISTDEVYGSLGATGYFTETSPYAPNSPYSASKASSDHLVRSYFHTFGLNTVITNCSNNFGPRQHREKLIPTIISNAFHLRPIPIYGDGQNVRDWLSVFDHCRAIDRVYRRGKAGETYAIGGNCELSNIQIVQQICQYLDQHYPQSQHSSYRDLITFVKDRPGHDRRYAIDPTKIESQLGFTPSPDFSQALGQTIDWYWNKLKKS